MTITIARAYVLNIAPCIPVEIPQLAHCQMHDTVHQLKRNPMQIVPKMIFVPDDWNGSVLVLPLVYQFGNDNNVYYQEKNSWHY